MISPDVIDALTPIVDALDKLGVAYIIGGSIASSVFGIGRSTLDADVVADLKLTQVAPFVALLEDNYYISPEMIKDAIQRRSSFNVIHNELAFKIDIFIPKEGAFDRIEFTRARQETLSEEPGAHLFNVASPEDIVLRKLDWFKVGGSVSERQWLDTLGVLKLQANALDYAYLRHWAERLGLADLLQQAFVDAGVEE